MANEMDIKSIRETSMKLNTQAGCGAEKPTGAGGSDSPGGTKPPRVTEKSVSMPK